MKPTHEEVAAVVERSVTKGRTAPLVVGFRTSPATPNAFDDWLCWFDPKRPETFFATPATTEPGTYWLQNPGRVAGTFVLALGYHAGMWRLGQHHAGKPEAYDAFVQAAKVYAHRDADRDALAETSSPATLEPITGINLHRASATSLSTKVEKWSAGCQVTNGAPGLGGLLERARASGLDRFDYLLVERPVEGFGG